MLGRCLVVATLAAAPMLGAIPARAGQGISTEVQGNAPQTVQSYWTASRLRAAQPLAPRVATGPDGLPIAAGGATTNAVAAPEPSQRGAGSPPSVAGVPGRTLFTVPPMPTLAPAASAASGMSGVLTPFATSSYGARYTTAREPAPAVYPASAVGKLYFHDPKSGGDYVCSASVIRPRVVVTAGHCIAHPSTSASGRYFYTGHTFVPAFTAGAAPFGTWQASKLLVTDTWYTGPGTVPNAADEGLLVIADQTIKGKATTIGSVTGWFGYVTGALANNNLTMKGYPCNLDGCSYMETNNAQTFAAGGNNTWIYGSAMRGGESGGPWLQDYGVAPVSNPTVSGLGGNLIAAVTSYGPVATEPAFLGASQLDSTFVKMLNTACAAAAGNC